MDVWQHGLEMLDISTAEVKIDIEGEYVEDSTLRQLFWEEVRHFHPQLPAQP